MSKVNQELDRMLEQWYPDVYRFCFLMSCQAQAAEEIAFQTFLYAGSEPEFEGIQPEEEAFHLFRRAAQTCEDYYLRRMRRMPSRSRLQESVSFPIGDALWELLRRPYRQKAVLFLHYNMGFSAGQIFDLLKSRTVKPERLLGSLPPLAPELTASIIPDEETLEQVSDELYLRFEERNVRLENRLRNLRYVMDRAVVWIALLILILFAAAAVYTSNLSF